MFPDTKRFRLLLAAPLLLLLASAGEAQQDSVTVVVGPEYDVSETAEIFLGDDYRDLWITPVRLPVLELRTFAGGLAPLKRGGGLQTKVLHFTGADGQRWVFRSANKDPALADRPTIEGTVVEKIIEDQVSALQPAAAVVAASLLETAGVLHATPVMVVMPDDPGLGEFRKEFAGVVGTIEVRADEGEDDTRGFAGSAKIVKTETLLETIEEGPEDRVDARAYLRARLMDVFLGDWDRHLDQWRWARFERGGRNAWLPIPRDRDYAFVDYDGLFMMVGRKFFPKGVRFTEDYENLFGLIINGRQMDRELLSELPRAAWDSVAADLQARLTDETVERAVRQMPPEYQALNGAQLTRGLLSRRDRLNGAAERYYALLATDVDVRATDERELATMEWLPGGALDVRIHERRKGTDLPEGAPYFQRTFLPDETREVRLYLRGGDDIAVVRGTAGPGAVVARVIGGGGDDVLADSSRVEGLPKVGFYDHRGDNRFVRRPGTIVDTRDYEAPENSPTASGVGYRDWGESSSWFAPWVDYKGTEGVIVGGGPTYTRYGFRRVPYAYRLGLRGMVGLDSRDLGVVATADVRRTGAPGGVRLDARATELVDFRFYGFGNDTERLLDKDAYTVPLGQVVVQGELYRPVHGPLWFAAGPIVKYTDPEVREGTPLGTLRPYGSEPLAQTGVHGRLTLDTRNSAAVPTAGVIAEVGAAAYPEAWDLTGAFARTTAVATGYLPLPVPLRPVLALRAGAERVTGDFPVHEAAFLGGSRNLRGYTYQRFAGDALVFGNLEMRVPVAPLELLLRGQLGVLGLVDAGRVYMDGSSPGGWHSSTGAGLWWATSFSDQEIAVSAFYAKGNEGKIYLRLGLPF